VSVAELIVDSLLLQVLLTEVSKLFLELLSRILLLLSSLFLLFELILCFLRLHAGLLTVLVVLGEILLSSVN